MEPKIQDSDHQTTNSNSMPLSSRTLAAVVLISVIFGIFGGAAGSLYFSKLPTFQKLFGSKQSVVSRNVYEEQSTITELVKKASPAVVSIVISKDLNTVPGFGLNPFSPLFGFGQQNSTSPNVQEVGAGSGFFVSSDGLILTNKHVVSDQQASYTVITSDGTSYDAKVLATDPANDLAIVKVDIKNAPFLTLTDSSQIQIGQSAIAIGNSLGQYQNTVTTGIISGIGRSITAGGAGESEQLEGVIQTDAAINPGNSGGPLLNLAGEVMGINTAVDAQGQSVGFALPANDAAKALESFNKSGSIKRPLLGVRYVMINKALATQEKLPRDYGALISRGSGNSAVVAGSGADKAGLQENDIILEVNGHRIDENNSLAKELKNYNVGDTITLKIYHDGSEKTVPVTLGEA